MTAVHVINRILAVVLGLAIAILGVLVPIEIVLGALGRPHLVLPWEHLTDLLRRNSWAAGGTRAVLIGVTILGLILLVRGLRRGRPSLLALADPSPGVEPGTTRRSVQRALATTAGNVDGVASAKARVKRRRAKVVVVSRLRNPAGLQEQVRERVAARLDNLRLASPPALVVRLKHKEH